MDNPISWSQHSVKSEVTEFASGSSEQAAGKMYSSAYPTPVFPADDYSKLDPAPTTDTELTYTTLESVKLVQPTQENMMRVAAPAPIVDHTDQPIDLSLTRQIDMTDLNHFNNQPQSGCENYLQNHFLGQEPISTTQMMKVNVLNPPQAHTIQSVAGTSHQPPVTRPPLRQNQPPRSSGYDKLRSLVCEYIDYLIEENEHITQISRAYTMPTPLDFENEHYFEEVRNTDHHFPSERFQAWLKMKEEQVLKNRTRSAKREAIAEDPAGGQPEPKRQRKKLRDQNE